MKNKLIILGCSILLSVTLKAQMKVGNNPTVINSASLLELETTNKGLVFPRVLLTNVTSPSPLPAGLLTGTVVYNTNAAIANGNGIGIYVWGGSVWTSIASNSSATGWSLTGNAGTNYATNFIGTTNKVGFRVRTNNIERMLIDSLGNVTTTAQTVKTKLGAGGKFLIVNSGTGANELIKLLIRETGEVNWYLDGQDLFMRDGFFDAFGTGTLYKYDFMHIDGTNGRIGFNILNGYSDGTAGGENDLPLTSSVTLQGSIATKVRFLGGNDSNYQIKQDDHIMIIDAPSGKTVNMILSPVATSRGREYIFKRNENKSNNVVVQAAPGEKLDGVVNGSVTLGTDNSSLEVVCGPDSWWVTSEISVKTLEQVTTTSITASDKNIIEVNFTSAGQIINIRLPSAADNEDKTYIIKRNANGAVYPGNVLRIVPASGENLDQSSFDSPYIMENDFESVTVRSDSARWAILNNYNAENAVVAVTTAYTPYKNDKTILADASSASFTVTLPGAATVEKGKTYTIKRTNAGANTVIVDGKGSEKMDGIASLRLNQRFDYLQLQSDGTNWMIISERISPSLVVNPVLPYVATVYDGIISSNGSGTIKLPSAAAVLGGKIFTIKNSATAGNTRLTVNPKASETIDGLATWPLSTGQFVTIQSDGTNWVVIGQ